MGKQLSRHFNEDEFRCRHCRKLPEVGMHPELTRKLEVMRGIVGKPLIVTSGFRCETHNRNVGGAKSSQHLKGTAADVYAKGVSINVLVDAAEKAGFNGIGRYNTFVHVDVRPWKARW